MMKDALSFLVSGGVGCGVLGCSRCCGGVSIGLPFVVMVCLTVFHWSPMGILKAECAKTKHYFTAIALTV
jgi:hypothetical protein